RELVTDVNIEFTESGIKFMSIDSAHVALVSVFLESKSFKKYDYNKEETISINLDYLNKILSQVKNKDTLTLKKPEFLSVLYRGSDNYKETEYKIQLLNIDQEKLNILSTNYSVIINMPSDELKKIFLNQNIICETINITVKQNKKMIKFTSLDDFNNECINILKERKGSFDNEITIKAENNIDDLFSLKYLLLFTKASSLTHCVQICLE
ncbi:5216_t:CDS:1, partial [Cetraspora pellucida]